MSAAPTNYRAGAGLSLADVRAGRIISASSRGRRWRHPWFTGVQWQARAQRWLATVKPGFVGARTPVARTTIEEQQEVDPGFGINPLTGKPFFSDPIFNQETEGTGETQLVDIPITLDPAIALSFRNMGFDGEPRFSVPRFFRNRGVVLAPDLDPEIPFAATPELPRGARLLRAADLILHQPRSALTSNIELAPGLVTGQRHVVQTLAVRPQIAGDTLRIVSGTYQPGGPLGIDALTGLYEEAQWDELLISTVFLLSPPNTVPHSEPDGTWAAFVRHGLFWNVTYRRGVFRVPHVDPGVGFIPPLAFGVAQPVINYFTSAISDILADALNIITATSLAGTFFTPTGGGSTAEFPALAPSSAKPPGFSKRATIDAEAAAARAARAAEKLDPDFPYNAVPFVPALLAA